MTFFNPIQDGSFCHTYHTMMKLIHSHNSYILPKYINHAPLEFCLHEHFSPGISNFSNIAKQKWLVILLTFFDFLKAVLINVITIFDDFNKIGFPRPPSKTGILKVMTHNLCPWRQKQDFIIWIKLYWRCGTKVLVFLWKKLS